MDSRILVIRGLLLLPSGSNYYSQLSASEEMRVLKLDFPLLLSGLLANNLAAQIPDNLREMTVSCDF